MRSSRRSAAIPTTGQLYYDADGSGVGAPIRFATLTGAQTINVGDFPVI